MRTTAECIEALYNLNPGVVGTGAARHERPHKPALLLAVLDALAASDPIVPDRDSLSTRASENALHLVKPVGRNGC